LIERLSTPFELDGVSALIGASIGITFTDWQSQEPDEILRHADLAMYEAKKQGKRTQVVYDTSIGERATEATRVRDVIHQGLEHGWFTLNYQPIVNAESGSIAGIEVLLRLDSPTLGRLDPDSFIPVAEQSGQIVELRNLALQRGLADLDHILTGQSRSELFVAVNLSPRQLDDHFERKLAATLDDHPELVGRLVLEITETTLLQRHADIAARLSRLRKLGARIALDDFGTGYSCLSHIQQFPVDILKIDESFIGQLTSGPDGGHCPTAMVRAISLIGRELGIEVVAEGVEDRETVELLLNAEITLLQGYHYARPMDRPALDAWLTSPRAQPCGSAHPDGRRS
jgi:predicted signal transduction protein with EAL and GGDEF domain